MKDAAEIKPITERTLEMTLYNSSYSFSVVLEPFKNYLKQWIFTVSNMLILIHMINLYEVLEQEI